MGLTLGYTASVPNQNYYFLSASHLIIYISKQKNWGSKSLVFTTFSIHTTNITVEKSRY